MFHCLWLIVFELKCHLCYQLRDVFLRSQLCVVITPWKMYLWHPDESFGSFVCILFCQLWKQRSGPWMTSDLAVSKHTSEQGETGCTRISGGEYQRYLTWGTFATVLRFTQFSCQNEQAVSMATKNTKTMGRLMTPDNGNVFLKVY